MNILDPNLQADLDAGRPVKLNLGAGKRPLPGFYSVDLECLPGVAAQADLNQPLDLIPDHSVETIHTRHTLEHVANLLPLMGELHRILRPGGTIEIRVPHFSNPYGYSDPTHLRFFGLYTFYYFSEPNNQLARKVPSFYTHSRFRVEKVEIRLMHKSWVDKVFRAILEPLINRSSSWQDWYERRLAWIFPASEIRYHLTKTGQGNEISLPRAA